MVRRDPKIADFARRVLQGNELLYSFFGSLYHHSKLLSEIIYLLYVNRKISIFYPNLRSLAKLKSEGYRSQFGQDYFLVKEGLIPKRGGQFLDIGCNHPEQENNTYYLEHTLDYTGICLDPIARDDIWVEARPKSKFLKMAVSDSYGEIDFVEVQDQSGWQTMLSGPLTTLDISGREVDYSVKKVPTITLEEILSTHFDSPPDVMTLDVEGHELNVLKSCSWKVNKPRVIVIENCGSLRKQTTVRKFLYSKGYALYGRIWISDDVFILTET